MDYFSTKKQIRTFKYCIHWNRNIQKKFFFKKINDIVEWNNIQGAVLIKKSNSAMSILLCKGANFVKKNSWLVAGIVSFDTVGLYLLTFCILESYPHKDILTLIAFL